MAIVEAMTQLSIKNILYATDFSESSRAALPYAVAIARRFESTVHVVHAVTPVMMVLPFEPFPTDYRSPAEKQMATLLHSDQFKDVAYGGLVEEGYLWSVLKKLFQEQKFDLIVLGTHGRGGVEKLALGSAAEEIIRSVPCPVLAVGPHVPADVTPEFKPLEILCATDLLSDSSEAVSWSVGLAQERGVHLTLVHAIHTRNEDLACPNAVEWDVKRQLKSLLPAEGNLSSAPEFMVEFGPTAEVILRAAEEKRADLIVMGVKHTDHPWLTSHVAWVTIHKVLVQATCPVVTVPGIN
jgi:nucleotide-binding universal stress UspA family protein